MVGGAVEREKKDARGGQKANPPFWGLPGKDSFRREFRHLMFDVQDAEYRAYIRSRFVRLWGWLQEKGKHHKHGGYSIKLRDQFFERGALRADICHLVGDGGRGGEPSAELAEMLERHRGTDRFAAYFTSHPHLVEAYLPHIWDNDFPHDLAGVIRAYIPLAIECDPNKLK